MDSNNKSKFGELLEESIKESNPDMNQLIEEKGVKVFVDSAAVVINDGGVIVVLLEDNDCRIVHHILQIFVNEVVYVLIREVYIHLCICSRAAC